MHKVKISNEMNETNNNQQGNNASEKMSKTRDMIMERAQKLTGALYRVTDIMSDKEPLKWSLRERAMELFNELVSVMSAADLRDRNVVFEEIKNHTLRIEKILELTSIGTYTTSFNFDVLKREYHNLQLLIEGEKNLFVSEPFLALGEHGEDTSPVRSLLTVSDISSETKQSYSLPQSIGQSTSSGVKDTEKEKNDKGHKGQEVSKRESGSSNNLRHPKIIEFLKNNGGKTVRDVSSMFSGISEKTVQRDLLELVKTGQLFTRGEKRWRTYSLNKPN